MKRTIIRTTLVAALALAACSNDADPGGMPMDHSSASSAGSATAPPAGDFNQADVTFAQMMIPHHQQAIDMSDMILAKDGVHPEVRALAEQIKAAQQPEIDTMNRWLDAWGRRDMDEGGQHHGSGGGMMTEDDMRQLDKANASTGQRLFLEGMIKHHQGAIATAETELDEGQHPDAKQLAGAIITAQEAEIGTMNQLLGQVG